MSRENVGIRLIHGGISSYKYLMSKSYDYIFYGYDDIPNGHNVVVSLGILIGINLFNIAIISGLLLVRLAVLFTVTNKLSVYQGKEDDV